MKNVFTFFLICWITSLSAQEADNFTDNKSDRPSDPRADQMNFVPNEVLVKFKDDVIINSGTQLKSAGISSIDRLLKANSVSSLKKLFPTEKKLKSAQIVKDPTGRDMKIPSLHNIYRITVPQLKSTGSNPTSIFQFMEELKALPEVEYAEPNYIFSIGDFKPAGREMTMLEAMAQPENAELSKTATGLAPNDPLYNQQWGIPATNIDDVWNTDTGDSTSIIAILDTGVDWTHPDLATNIWKNKQEIPGNGKDDDGNGKIDDIRGWDFINNDNNPMDDNSHGTHVAGIAAAVGNNGIGIAGANWRAKIMPIKVFQSSGKGDAATIALGVTYAANKGAKVINMSFGSYAESLTLKNALASAYATAILVAAAGNDGRCIGPGSGCAPMFPAAYSFVLGVEATNSGFSNFDQDGPVFSLYPELHNYELKAPGVGILSCVPGGNYREYSGTSMAAPLVAGAISLYREQRPTEPQQLLFGNFINSINEQINLLGALNMIPVPKLEIVSYEMNDTIDGDRDGRPDAGETIELKVKVRNTWGQANNVKVGISFGEFEDQTTATILTPEATVGSVSAYATLFNNIPLKIKISKNIPDSREINFSIQTWYDDHQGEKSQPITLSVEHGKELLGILGDTLILKSDNLWIVNGSFKISPTGVLIIKPGTHLKINTKIINDGTIIAKGTKDSIINISGTQITGGKFIADQIVLNLTNNVSFGSVAKITNSYISMNGSHGFRGTFTFEDCFFENCKVYKLFFPYASTQIRRCTFYNITAVSFPNSASVFDDRQNYAITSNSSFINCFQLNEAYSGNTNLLKCNLLDNFQKVILFASSGYFQYLPNNYWGTKDSVKISKKIVDFFEDSSFPQVKFYPILTAPSDSSHAVVWKILVNGKDAQDEIVDPVGVGKQRFDIYFNRPMDKTTTPEVSFGVRSPFNQQIVNENGTWSTDGRIYTAYKTIQLTTGDGLNRIRVSGAKETNGWDFKIPVEALRFEFIISAAASASAEFQATAGLGKVNLEWNNTKLTDGLGFNMYRMEQLTSTTLSKPVLINSTLITDTVYTDFAVTPNKKYFYYYKILRTNLEETDSSKVVAVIPFTAALGDANGDLSVNVLDITTIVAYLLNQNPQPFIFEAADVNSDGNINVLDIVGVVNLVLHPKSAMIPTTEQVHLYMQNDTLFADAPVAVGGIQWDISGVSSVEEIVRLKALDGFESGYSVKDNSLRMMFYSLSGKTVPAGKRIPLLKMKKGTGITNIIFGDKAGSPIQVDYLATGVWNLSDNLSQQVAELGQNFPNPLTDQTTIPIRINEPVDEVVVRIVNIFGQEVKTFRLENPTVGEHLLNWNPGLNKGLMAYTLEIRRGTKRFVCAVRKMVIQ